MVDSRLYRQAAVPELTYLEEEVYYTHQENSRAIAKSSEALEYFFSSSFFFSFFAVRIGYV